MDLWQADSYNSDQPLLVGERVVISCRRDGGLNIGIPNICVAPSLLIYFFFKEMKCNFHLFVFASYFSNLDHVKLFIQEQICVACVFFIVGLNFISALFCRNEGANCFASVGSKALCFDIIKKYKIVLFPKLYLYKLWCGAQTDGRLCYI